VRDSSVNVVYYERDGEKMKIGKAEIESITYATHRSKLYNVMILFKGILKGSHDSADQLMGILWTHYGEPDEGDGPPAQFKWKGKTVSVFFYYNVDAERGHLEYTWEPGVQAMEAEQEEEFRKEMKAGADDL